MKIGGICNMRHWLREMDASYGRQRSRYVNVALSNDASVVAVASAVANVIPFHSSVVASVARRQE